MAFRPERISLSVFQSMGEMVFTGPDGSACEILPTTRPPAESAFIDRLSREPDAAPAIPLARLELLLVGLRPGLLEAYVSH